LHEAYYYILNREYFFVIINMEILKFKAAAIAYV